MESLKKKNDKAAINITTRMILPEQNQIYTYVHPMKESYTRMTIYIFLSAMNLLIFWTPNNNLYCLLSFSRGAVKTSHEVQSFLLR